MNISSHRYPSVLRLALLLVAAMLAWTTPCVANAVPLNTDGEPIKVHTFDKKALDEATNGLDFNENQPKKQQNIQLQKPTKSYLPDKQNIRILLYIAGIGLLTFLVLKLMGIQIIGNKKIAQQITFDLENLDEHIHETELDKYLREAIRDKQYRSAIRIQYLMVIKKLSEKQLIAWKKQKTNHDYLLEMETHPYKNHFQQLTSIFEHIWYGDKPITQLDFQHIQPQFDSFLNNI